MTQLHFTRMNILRETNLGIVHWRRQEPISCNRISRRYICLHEFIRMLDKQEAIAKEQQVIEQLDEYNSTRLIIKL
jgi:hypothetical protein